MFVDRNREFVILRNKFIMSFRWKLELLIFGYWYEDLGVYVGLLQLVEVYKLVGEDFVVVWNDIFF